MYLSLMEEIMKIPNNDFIKSTVDQFISWADKFEISSVQVD